MQVRDKKSKKIYTVTKIDKTEYATWFYLSNNKIYGKKVFEEKFERIKDESSKSRAESFLLELKSSISSLDQMPTRCRNSYYTTSKNCKDLIFKGYSIVFKISNTQVHILSIFRQRSY